LKDLWRLVGWMTGTLELMGAVVRYINVPGILFPVP
jgi:hypothetical protein